MAAFRRVAYSMGMLVRETGQALDRLGGSMQGIYAYREQRKFLSDGSAFLSTKGPGVMVYGFAT